MEKGKDFIYQSVRNVTGYVQKTKRNTTEVFISEATI